MQWFCLSVCCQKVWSSPLNRPNSWGASHKSVGTESNYVACGVVGLLLAGLLKFKKVYAMCCHSSIVIADPLRHRLHRCVITAVIAVVSYFFSCTLINIYDISCIHPQTVHSQSCVGENAKKKQQSSNRGLHFYVPLPRSSPALSGESWFRFV